MSGNTRRIRRRAVRAKRCTRRRKAAWPSQRGHEVKKLWHQMWVEQEEGWDGYGENIRFSFCIAL